MGTPRGEDRTIKDNQFSDNDHEVQRRLLEAIEDGLSQCRDPEEIADIVNQLLEYTKIHVLSEELLMQMYCYPGYHRHRRQHDKMVSNIEELAVENIEGDTATLEHLLNNFKIWLESHITKDDSKFCKFFLSIINNQYE